MARKKGSKCVPEARAKAIHGMACVGVRICDIAGYYNMPRSTVSNVIRRLRNRSTMHKKKMGRKAKLSERGMCLFKKYALQNRFNALFVILVRFKQASGVSLSKQTGRRYIRKLKMQSYVAIQKP